MLKKIKKILALPSAFISKKEIKAEKVVRDLVAAIPYKGIVLVIAKNGDAILGKKYNGTTIFYGTDKEGQLCPLVKVRNGEVTGDAEKVAGIIRHPDYITIGSCESVIKITAETFEELE